MKNRIQEIKSKGFNIPIQDDSTDVYSQAHSLIDFSKIKVGAKMLDDAVVTIGDLKKINPRLADKTTVLRAIHNGDIGNSKNFKGLDNHASKLLINLRGTFNDYSIGT